MQFCETFPGAFLQGGSPATCLNGSLCPGEGLGRRQFNPDKLRAVVKAKGDNAVAQPPAYDHIGIALRKQPCVIFWEKALVWSDQPAHKGKAELSAVGVPGQYQIHAGGYIGIKKLRSVGKEDEIGRAHV